MPLRINDIKLPLNHGDADLRIAVLVTLGISEHDLHGLQVVRRAVRRKEEVGDRIDLQRRCRCDGDRRAQALLARFAGSKTW